jgi:hypothetical protein
LGMMAHACNPSHLGGRNRITIWGLPREKACDPIWKITEVKRAECVTQVVEHPPSKHEDLTANTIITKKKYLGVSYIFVLHK